MAGEAARCTGRRGALRFAVAFDGFLARVLHQVAAIDHFRNELFLMPMLMSKIHAKNCRRDGRLLRRCRRLKTALLQIPLYPAKTI
jgi:hypothetical protein